MDDRVIDIIILPEKQKPCDNVQGNAINAVWKDAQRDFVKYEIGKNESCELLKDCWLPEDNKENNVHSGAFVLKWQDGYHQESRMA